MSSFSINESLFVLDLDDDAPSILPVGEVLPDGIKSVSIAIAVSNSPFT